MPFHNPVSYTRLSSSSDTTLGYVSLTPWISCNGYWDWRFAGAYHTTPARFAQLPLGYSTLTSPTIRPYLSLEAERFPSPTLALSTYSSGLAGGLDASRPLRTSATSHRLESFSLAAGMLATPSTVHSGLSSLFDRSYAMASTDITNLASPRSLVLPSQEASPLPRSLYTVGGSLQPHTEFQMLVNVQMFAPGFVSMCAQRGFLGIVGSQIQGKELTIGSRWAGTFELRDGTVTKAGGSSIQLGYGCSIKGSGNAKVHQDEFGNIIFSV